MQHRWCCGISNMMRSVAFIWLVMLLGCAQVPQFESSTGPDRYQVAETALRFLMDANSGQGVERDYYSAYVIRPGEFTSQLVAAFSHYKPRVVSDIEVSTQNGGAA